MNNYDWIKYVNTYLNINEMINENFWNKIIEDYSEDNIIKIFKNNKISLRFIVGRLAKNKCFKYDSELYNKYRHI